MKNCYPVEELHVGMKIWDNKTIRVVKDITAHEDPRLIWLTMSHTSGPVRIAVPKDLEVRMFDL